LASTLDVHVVSLEGTVERLRATWPRVASLGDRLHGLDKPPGIDPGTVVRLIRLLREISPMAVHTHHIGPLLYGGLAARLTGVQRLIHTEHDAWHLTTRRRRRLEGWALALLRPHLVADAHVVADALLKVAPRSRPQIVLNGVDTNCFSPGDKMSARLMLGLPETVRLIGTAGRLELVKGQDLLIEALAGLPKDVEIVIAGGGSCRGSLEGQALDLGLGGRVHFLGHIEDTATFYRALDLFCLPSRAEGLPLSLLEAQACGIPAIVTDVGGMREILAPCASCAVAPGDSARLAEALGRMLATTASAHVADPRPFIVERYDVRNMVDAYRALLTV
jgi:glycosyltransferase involved in cell wall biosynthesis